jgi:hypothetical protein
MNPVLNFKTTKDYTINSYTKKKLDIDTTKIEKAIVKIKKIKSRWRINIERKIDEERITMNK